MATLVETTTTALPRVDVDPVTVDIIENALRHARFEMDAVLFRYSSRPPRQVSPQTSSCPATVPTAPTPTRIRGDRRRRARAPRHAEVLPTCMR